MSPQATHPVHLYHPGFCGHSALVQLQASSSWQRVMPGRQLSKQSSPTTQPERQNNGKSVQANSPLLLLLWKKSTQRANKTLLCVFSTLDYIKSSRMIAFLHTLILLMVCVLAGKWIVLNPGLLTGYVPVYSMTVHIVC